MKSANEKRSEGEISMEPARGSRDPDRIWELRRNRVARRLDKIEKEMGFLEIKLEKERRLQKQVEFLKHDIAELDKLIGRYTVWTSNHPLAGGRVQALQTSRRF